MITRAHTIEWTGPVPRFFDAALMGNGSLGVALSTRPDAILLRLGSNDVWDRRIDESHADGILTFDEVLRRVEDADPALHRLEDDPWFAEYRARMVAAYARPYPRPLPCGGLVLGFEPRDVEVLGHSLDLATGVCTVHLRDRGRDVDVEVFVHQEADEVHLRTVSPDGTPAPAPFTRVHLLPDPDGPASDAAEDAATGTFILPRPGEVPLREAVTVLDVPDGLAYREDLPPLRPGERPQGALSLRLTATAAISPEARVDWYGDVVPAAPLEGSVAGVAPFWGVLELRHAYGDDAETAVAPGAEPAGAARHDRARTASLANWSAYWGRSRIALSDRYLEDVWYRNTYFLHCAVRERSAAPGLFGNWLYRGVGAAWHGDYHMNYNAQQVYWGVFSSNRVEQHLPYVSLVDRIAPVARSWARDYYGMRGAAYPHSAYNAPMTVNPYPNPVWAWEVSESPWAVQSLWWHYLYTRDADYLRERAMPRLQEVVEFLVDYLSRPGASARWDDGRFHVFPTVPPELYGLRPGLSMNADCLLDLALIRFVFDAFAEGCRVLGSGEEHAELLGAAAALGAGLADYPMAQTPDGPVFVSVPGEAADTVYNVPIPGMTVFPGEQHSWESPPETVDALRRSISRQRLEGGNELVFRNLQAVRMGALDLDRFVRQLRYCELGNGTFTDMALQVHGRYNDATDFEFMADKGVWVENFALTAVINEMLLQGYSGTVRVFPNCEGLAHAEFERLRAPGAFLVSAALADGGVSFVRVESEAGGTLRILVPWAGGGVLERADGREELGAGIVEIPTLRGEELTLRPRGGAGAPRLG